MIVVNKLSDFSIELTNARKEINEYLDTEGRLYRQDYYSSGTECPFVDFDRIKNDILWRLQVVNLIPEKERKK